MKAKTARAGSSAHSLMGKNCCTQEEHDKLLTLELEHVQNSAQELEDESDDASESASRGPGAESRSVPVVNFDRGVQTFRTPPPRIRIATSPPREEVDDVPEDVAWLISKVVREEFAAEAALHAGSTSAAPGPLRRRCCWRSMRTLQRRRNVPLVRRARQGSRKLTWNGWGCLTLVVIEQSVRKTEEARPSTKDGRLRSISLTGPRPVFGSCQEESVARTLLPLPPSRMRVTRLCRQRCLPMPLCLPSVQLRRRRIRKRR